MHIKPVYLKQREERRVRAGHGWIFSNEIDTAKSPLTGFESGEPVVVLSAAGKPLGTAYINPKTLICARMVSRDASRVLDSELLGTRLHQALALRERLCDEPWYRLVYGESDALPGLVVDRYAELLVVQLGTAGMERLKPAIIESLRSISGVESILLKNDGAGRALEGLSQYVERVGDVPDVIEVKESGARFSVPIATGQKTGWFYDHRLNRLRVASYAPGQHVLDVFSYCGAFGIQAALHGAASVRLVDSSESALSCAAESARRNGVSGSVDCVQGDAFDSLKTFAERGERFDLVIVDPPAFARRKRDLPGALEAYTRINRYAMRLIEQDGVLATASCSSHVSERDLVDCVRKAARAASRRVQILERGHQGPDHPVHPSIPETDYLKLLICRVMA